MTILYWILNELILFLLFGSFRVIYFFIIYLESWQIIIILILIIIYKLSSFIWPLSVILFKRRWGWFFLLSLFVKGNRFLIVFILVIFFLILLISFRRFGHFCFSWRKIFGYWLWLWFIVNRCACSWIVLIWMLFRMSWWEVVLRRGLGLFFEFLLEFLESESEVLVLFFVLFDEDFVVFLFLFMLLSFLLKLFFKVFNLFFVFLKILALRGHGGLNLSLHDSTLVFDFLDFLLFKGLKLLLFFFHLLFVLYFLFLEKIAQISVLFS